jgi:hypothetical protein
LDDFGNIQRITSGFPNKYWFITPERFALATMENGILELIEKYYPDHFGIDPVEVHSNVVHLNDTIRLFGMDNGFSIFTHSNSPASENLNNLTLRRIYSSDGLLDLYPDKKRKINYRNNFIRFDYAWPFSSSRGVMFKYKLEGLSDEWSDLTTETYSSYYRLPPGNYTFRVKADNTQENPEEEIYYDFVINSPWYTSNFAVFTYFLLLMLFVFLIRTYYKKSFNRKKELLKIKMQKEKEEQLKLESLENQKRIIALENKRLEDEIKHKSKQLANSTVGIIKKNEILKEMKTEIIRQTRNKVPANVLQEEILKLINENLKSDEDWQVFLSNFDIAHENFLKKIKTRFTTLTPKELRFCAYLRMNISSKEIASLLNMSVRGVEIKRYRLRKKLQLLPEEDLVEFIMDI